MSALLFDLDDTLLEYSAGIEATTLVAAVEDVRRWFWADVERNRRERTDMVGAWTKIAAAALERCGGASDGLAARIAADFADRRWRAMRLFPDALATLRTLREQRVPLALVTNGDARLQREKLARFDLTRYFEVVVIEGEFGVGKPDARVFRHALAALGAEPARTWMVGDNLDFDVAGAQRVGVRTAWLDRMGHGLPAASPARPDRIIRGLGELFPLG